MRITAANTLLTSDFIDSAKSATTHQAFAGNAELEELTVLFRDYHKAIFRIAYRITGSRSDAEVSKVLFHLTRLVEGNVTVRVFIIN